MGAYGTSQGGGAWGGLGGTPQLGNLPLRALVCDGAITGWLGYGYLRMRDYGYSLYMPSTLGMANYACVITDPVYICHLPKSS